MTLSSVLLLGPCHLSVKVDLIAGPKTLVKLVALVVAHLRPLGLWVASLAVVGDGACLSQLGLGVLDRLWSSIESVLVGLLHLNSLLLVHSRHLALLQWKLVRLARRYWHLGVEIVLVISSLSCGCTSIVALGVSLGGMCAILGDKDSLKGGSSAAILDHHLL